jgi:hypothetical protein
MLLPASRHEAMIDEVRNQLVSLLILTGLGDYNFVLSSADTDNDVG